MYIACCGNLQFTSQVQNVLEEVLVFLRQHGVQMFQGQRVILTLENEHTIALKDPVAQ
jgi:hypothetical protein